MSFDQLGLSPELLRAVADQGYTEPTPVQAQAIPFILAGRDVLAGAQTGTGKTAAFVLPILQRLHAVAARPAAPLRPGQPPRRLPRVLVLVPTRELALQVEESVRTYRRPAARPLGPDLRRRRLRAPIPRTPERAGDRRGHARPAPRSHRPADRRLLGGRGPRPRRGGPDAGHGVHPGHPADPRDASCGAPEPPVLGDLQRRHPASWRRASCATPRRSRRRPGTRRRPSSGRSSSGWTGSASAISCASSSPPAGWTRPSSSPARSTARTASRSSS